MKRDWDVIRQILLEVENLSEFERGNASYELGGEVEIDDQKNWHALLLWKAGFVSGIDASSMSGPSLDAPELTWAGHDLLDTLRSKPGIVTSPCGSSARWRGTHWLT
jgi:hypothetical protein